MLAMRAKMLENQQGVKIHNRDLPEPTNKQIQHMTIKNYGPYKRQMYNEQLASHKNSTESLELDRKKSTPLKFKMRDTLQISMQKRSNIARRAVLEGVTNFDNKAKSIEKMETLGFEEETNPLRIEDLPKKDTNFTIGDDDNSYGMKGTRTMNAWLGPYIDSIVQQPRLSQK